MKHAFAVVSALMLVGCDPLHDSAPKPWMGYAWNAKEKRIEWFFSQFETYRDCQESMQNSIETPPNNQWYSNPIGCGYSGNDYYRVVVMNAIFGGKELGCIARSLDPEIQKSGLGYGPILSKEIKRTDRWYCM